MRRTVLPVFAATLATGAIVAGAFGLGAALPQPTRSDRVAVRALTYLEHGRTRGSRIQIGGRRLEARCVSLSPRRKLILLSDGTQFVLRGSRIRAWSRFTSGPEQAPVTSGWAKAAIADLAGSFGLYAAELTATIERGEALVVGTGDSYRIVLGRRPHVELEVERSSLRPLSARFRSRRVSASASLLRPVEGPLVGTC